MYYINKIVGFIASPIGVAIFGGVLALICAKLGRGRVAKWSGALTLAWLWLWMTPIMTLVVGVPLEREFLVNGRVPPVESFPKADAIVLLGGSMGVETNLSTYAEMWGSADRVWQAARLWKAGKAPRVIATGDGARDSTLSLLKDFGVGEVAVLFLDARNTEDEAKGVLELFNAEKQRGGEDEVKVKVKVKGNGEEGKKVKVKVKGGKNEVKVKGKVKGKVKVLLVTSAWHMKRARMMFKKYAPDVEVVCAPADFENSMMVEGVVFLRALFPDFNAFALNSIAFHEWVGIVGYSLFR